MGRIGLIRREKTQTQGEKMSIRENLNLDSKNGACPLFLNNSSKPGLFTSRGRRRHRCEERSECGNPMLLRMDMRSPRFARDDN